VFYVMIALALLPIAVALSFVLAQLIVKIRKCCARRKEHGQHSIDSKFSSSHDQVVPVSPERKRELQQVLSKAVHEAISSATNSPTRPPKNLKLGIENSDTASDVEESSENAEFVAVELSPSTTATAAESIPSDEHMTVELTPSEVDSPRLEKQKETEEPVEETKDSQNENDNVSTDAPDVADDDDENTDLAHVKITIADADDAAKADTAANHDDDTHPSQQ